MKILAHIPVEKIITEHYTTFRTEVREVEVLQICRTPATRYPSLNRWHYQAIVKKHPDLHIDYHCVDDVGHRVNIQRQGLNDKWKPPVFPDGKNWIEVIE